MKSILLVFLVSIMSSAALADVFCEKVVEPVDVENPTAEQLSGYNKYSITESLNKFYKGERMRFKTSEELVKHQATLSEKINETTKYFGYAVTVDQVLSCSNKNTAKIDFDLLRFAVYHSLRSFYIF